MGDRKFWDVTLDETTNKYKDCFSKFNCGKGLCLFTNGRLDHYVYKDNKREVKNSSGDNYYVTEWTYSKNGNIVIAGNLKVVKITEDSLILSSNDKTFVYVKSLFEWKTSLVQSANSRSKLFKDIIS